MATEQEFIDKVKAKLASESITLNEAKAAITKYRELSANNTLGTAQVVPPAPKQESGFGEKLIGGAETALSVGTSALALPLSGLAGIAASPWGNDAASSVVKNVQEGMTYQPKTESGQGQMQAVGGAIGAATDVFNQAAGRSAGALVSAIPGDIAYKGPQVQELIAEQGLTGAMGEAGFAVGGPIGGAIASALPEAIAQIVAFKGTKAAKITKIKQEVEKSGADALLTPEARDALTTSGFSAAEIDSIIELDPGQLARLERFKRLDIQPTRGDVTMQTAQRKAEQQLMETAGGEPSLKMQTLRGQQTQSVVKSLDDIIDSTGLPDLLGESIKSAVRSRKKFVKSEAQAAYKALADSQAETGGIPLLMGDFKLIDGMPTEKELRVISKLNKTEYDALQDSLAEVGLSNDEAALKRLTAEGLVPEQISLENFEVLRQSLGRIKQADQTGNMGRVIGPIMEELDRQVDFATGALTHSSSLDVAYAAKEARRSWRAYKTEFDPNTIAAKMIQNKPKSVIPFIEDSQAYGKISAKSVPIEQVDRLLQTLTNQGAKGNRAIANLQSNMVTDLLDSLVTGYSNKIGDVPVMSGANFSKKFNDPNFQDKMKLVFENNPRVLSQLQDVELAVRDLTPGKLEIVKGSGSVILDVMNSIGVVKVFGAIPGGGLIMEQLRDLSARSKNRTAFKRAIDARPEIKSAVTSINRDYPGLAAALGIGYIASEDENQ